MTNNIKPFITRAALTLALAMLTVATGWAKTVSNVPYVDADGIEQTATYAAVVTSDMGGTSNPNFNSGSTNWFYVNSDVTLSGAYDTGTSTQNIILGDGATLTISGHFMFGYASVNIYCQSGGTGKLVVSATYSDDLFYIGRNHTLTINGGTVEVTNQNYGNAFSGNLVMNGGTASFNGKKGFTMYAIYGTVTLNGGTFTATSNDYASEGICNSYVTIADGKYFKDGSGNIYYGSLSTEQKNALNGVTLSPATQTEYIQACLGTGNDGSASKPYTISDAAGWDAFCLALEDNDTWNRFSGKTVKLGADIEVSRMAGGDNPFCGNFDGGSNTLTFTATAAGNYCAPFVGVKGGTTAETATTISNLNVVTTITANDYRHMAGLIALQWGHVNVSGCNATVNISSTGISDNSHDLYPAGLVSQASSSDGGKLTVTGCTASGTISTDGKYAAGLVGIVQGTASISDCVSSVTINSSTSGDGTHGGIVGVTAKNTDLTITGTVFNGRLLGEDTESVGGFLGWRGNIATITNSIFAPAEVTVQNEGSATFARNTVDTYNCYYTTLLNDGTNHVPALADGTVSPAKWHNGKATRTVTPGADVTIEAVALTGTPTQYTVSGITAYSGGGLQRGQTLYYGSGDQLSLTLSNSATGAPQGYQYSAYTASAGTLSGSTLTMPDEDVTISVNPAALAPIDWATVNQGNSADPYMIYNKDQLLLLAHRVNGTNGETANGYNGKYFKLGADITFDHDANEGDDYAENYEAIGGYIGGTERYFKGKFDGANHTVSGIRIRKDGSGNAYIYQGLFGCIGSGANIHDVHLTDARIIGYNSVGGIAGNSIDGYIMRCSVTDSYITATHNANYGTICGITTKTDRLRNNYYHGCTVNSTAATSGKGCKGADITDYNGALPAYRLDLGENITTPPGTFVGQTEWLDTPPASPRLAPENGFTLAGNHYFASGYEFTPGSTLASGAAQGYTPRATLGDELLDPYTPTGDADPLAGTAIARLTITADCDGKTLAAALRSDGQSHDITYIDADGSTQTAQAIALDGTETSLAAGTYFAGLPTVQFDHKLTLTGNVTLILCDGCEMNVGESGSEVDGYGIICYANNTYYDLTICGQTAQTGTLSVYTTGPNNYAIGTHHITVNGGNVIAHTDGDGSSCGIDTKRSGNVTINSGSVSATTTSTDTFAWAISAAGNLTINGGNVSAKSNSHAILAEGNVAINGGTVNATGGDGGYSGIYSNGTIEINGGNVTASSIYSNGTITLGWNKPTDRITASSYTAENGTVKVASGKKLHNGSDYLGGTLSDPAAVNGKTLRPAATATYTTANGNTATADAILLDGSDTSLPAGNYLATGTLNYTHGITLAGDVTLILADNCHMNVGTSGGRIEGNGIAHIVDVALTITSQSLGDDMGALGVYTTGNLNHGICGVTLTINGGNVTADTDGYRSFALWTQNGDLTINGGTVSATTGSSADAIYACGDFNYNGGNVTATAAKFYAIYAVGNYTFSWRTPADRITIGATGLYANAAKTATFTRLFTDATGNYYGATLTGDELNALKGVTLEAAETADFTVTLAPKGYGTYYDGHYDITLPAGTQARIVTARGGTDGTLDYETIADGDDGITLPKTVPAGTAVMLCHDGGGSVTLTVNDADIDDRDFTDTDGNTLGLVSLLHGSDVATETTGGTLYYKLTYGSATGHESIFGWYWGAANGAAFESPAHKAWLALHAAEARSFIGLPDFDEQTGITTTNYTNDTNSAGAWYTLDGRKLDGTPMKSGIYVNNGKKVIIK